MFIQWAGLKCGYQLSYDHMTFFPEITEACNRLSKGKESETGEQMDTS